MKKDGYEFVEEILEDVGLSLEGQLEDVLDEVKGLTRALGEMTEMVKACLEKPQAEDGTQKAGFKIGADVDKSETDLNRIASIFGNV